MNSVVRPRRRHLTILIIVLLLGTVAAGGTYWYLNVGQWRETTDNAYLTGNLITVSAEVDGPVVQVAVEDNETVSAGQTLALIAEGDLLLTLDSRKQMLALAVQEVLARRAQVERARSELSLKEITHRLALEEYERRKRLAARRMLAEEELDAARTRAEETDGELETSRRALAEAQVRAGTGEVAAHPMVTAAASSVRAAWRMLRKARVVAPVDGTVAKRRVQVGQRVAPGSPLFSIAESGAVWIEANFKENQLRFMRPGQTVRIGSDLYDDEFEMRGKVQSIGSGTGSIFAVLPAQNATGNWIKIVQRVPVRIVIDGGLDPQHPLPLGAGLHVEVDTHERGISRTASATRIGPLGTSTAYDDRDAGGDELVAATISAAMGPGPAR
jgi:membrane fusion protein (multidrug efflux system)